MIERVKFRRFLAARLANEADADDLLQESLQRALQRGDSLQRGDRVVAWFYRILRNALTDHYRAKHRERKRFDQLLNEIGAAEVQAGQPASTDWETAVCACFRGLLPTLKPRYNELIRRVDLGGEDKNKVAVEMKMKPATLDVALHRARYALRDRLEVMCGACSRESCLACDCKLRARRSAEKV